MVKRATTLRQRLRDTATETLLDSAERAMVRKGFDRATMHDIAAAAGCATGTFYLYFKNKEELLQAIVARHARGMYAAARAAVQINDEPTAKLRASFEAFLRYQSEHRAFFRLFYAAIPLRYRALRQKIGNPALKEHDDFNRMGTAIIRQAQETGRLRKDIPADMLQEFIDSAGLSLSEQFVFMADPPPIEEQMHILWGLVGNGLGIRGNTDAKK